LERKRQKLVEKQTLNAQRPTPNLRKRKTNQEPRKAGRRTVKEEEDMFEVSAFAGALRRDK